MPQFVYMILALVAAYMIGSIPMGVFIVRAFTGEDVRTYGSGRTGGTNAMRAAGVWAGVITGLSDLAKGYVGVLLSQLLFPEAFLLHAACGAAAVAGHNWSVFLKFKGGAGGATNVGAATAMWPYFTPIMLIATPLALFVTGYASVASTFIAVFIPIGLAVLAKVIGLPWEYVLFGMTTLLMIAFALVPNYRRLLQGTERIVGPRAKAIAKRENAAT